MPRPISFADELPKTRSGKVLKRSLRDPFWRGHTRRGGLAPERDERQLLLR